MTLDGIISEKHKGDAGVTSCDSIRGDDDDSDATTTTAVTFATPAMPRERSELEVVGDDLQTYAFSASFLQKFEVTLAGMHIVQRKPIMLQPFFRELVDHVYGAKTMSANGASNGRTEDVLGLGVDVIGRPSLRPSSTT